VSIGAGQITAVMSLKADAGRMTDADLERELRWILQHGYAGARSRVASTMPGARGSRHGHGHAALARLYGGKQAADAMCSIGEAMIEAGRGSHTLRIRGVMGLATTLPAPQDRARWVSGEAAAEAARAVRAVAVDQSRGHAGGHTTRRGSCRRPARR
jgi:hypothetical protein